MRISSTATKKKAPAKKKAEEQDWTKPGRPATDKELEQMADEAEASPTISAKAARKLTLKAVKDWHKKNPK